MQYLWPEISPSLECTRCKNPIRVYVETVLSKAKPNCNKKKITFTLGDPAVYPEFQVDPSITKLLTNNLEQSLAIQEPDGPIRSRQYLSSIYSTDYWKLTPDDIVLTMGGSSSLWLLLCALTNPGDTILVPNPGFPLIFALTENRQVNIVTYDLKDGEDGHIDLQDLDKKLETSKAKFLLVNNPSNPLGTVWSKDHLEDILKVANKHKVPIVADEMYETLVFNNFESHCIGKLSRGQPIFVVSGLSKVCFVPGWRCGWIACFGRQDLISDVKKGLRRLTQMYLHPNAVASLNVPEIFEASKKFRKERMDSVETKVKLVKEKLKEVEGVSLCNTKGALYLSIFLNFRKFKDIDNSQSFALKMLEEENVNVMPGSLFYKDSMVRLVILCSNEDIEEFTGRFKEFCKRHSADEEKVIAK